VGSEMLSKNIKPFNDEEIPEEFSEAVADVHLLTKGTSLLKLIPQDSPQEEESRNSQTTFKKS
jgi:hypothetical protein